MSILDSDSDIRQNTDNSIKEQALTEFFYADLLGAHVSEVETDINPLWKKMTQTWQVDEGSTELVSKLVELLAKKNPLNPMLKRELSRPVYTLDCRFLCKFDAIGWLETIAKLPKSPKPILVIENITEIPEEDVVHDNPQYVRNLLMHSWKNPVKDFFNAKSQKSFTIVPADYTVFITWSSQNREKMDAIRDPSNGFAWIGNLKEYYKKILKDYENYSIKDLIQQQVITVDGCIQYLRTEPTCEQGSIFHTSRKIG